MHQKFCPKLTQNPKHRGIIKRASIAFPSSSAVEQLTVNQRVVGSNPASGAIFESHKAPEVSGAFSRPGILGLKTPQSPVE